MNPASRVRSTDSDCLAIKSSFSKKNWEIDASYGQLPVAGRGASAFKGVYIYLFSREICRDIAI